tara:strand:- start:16702 stop:17592 length:891 start_codon:yes stop_codon:yes gene_type:complete
MLFALLLGIAFHFLYEEGPCAPGIEFASRFLLQLGVALLGLGITISQIQSYGWEVLLIVLGGISVTLFSGPLLARIMKREWRLGILTGGAVAICGASAALAIATVLPKNRYSERNTVFTVISVTTLSTLAMILYPIISDWLVLDDFAAGVFIGATIHDVAQVIGAGYSISDIAGDTAAFVKLLRVTMLVPVIIILSLVFRPNQSDRSDRNTRVPLFIIGFVFFVLLGSTDLIPEIVRISLLELSRWSLVVAISAIGMKTALKSLGAVGGQAIILVCAETVVLAAVVLGFLLLPDFL